MGLYSDRLKLSMPDPGACNWHPDWYRNQQINDAVNTQVMEGNFTVSGGNFSGISGLDIDIDDTVVSIGGTEHTISAATLALTGATTEPEQMNWVYVDNAGVLQVSVVPPTGSFALLQLIDTNTTTTVRQADLRQNAISGGTLLGLSDTPSDYTGKAGAGLRVNSAENSVEFGGDIIPQSGVMVTGNILGLEFSMNVASPLDTIDIEKGDCYDSLNTTPIRYTGGTCKLDITGVASWVVDGSAVIINKVYNLFVNDSDEAWLDTDADGGNVSGSKRWIGYIKTNASGEIIEFIMVVDSITFFLPSATEIADTTSTLASIDFSDILPLSRVSHVYIGTSGTSAASAYLVSSDNGILDGVTGSVSVGNYTGAADGNIIFCPLTNPIYFRSTADTTIALRGCILKR